VNKPVCFEWEDNIKERDVNRRPPLYKGMDLCIPQRRVSYGISERLSSYQDEILSTELLKNQEIKGEKDKV
jgi:hypothetical protein